MLFFIINCYVFQKLDTTSVELKIYFSRGIKVGCLSNMFRQTNIDKLHHIKPSIDS